MPNRVRKTYQGGGFRQVRLAVVLAFFDPGCPGSGYLEEGTSRQNPKLGLKIKNRLRNSQKLGATGSLNKKILFLGTNRGERGLHNLVWQLRFHRLVADIAATVIATRRAFFLRWFWTTSDTPHMSAVTEHYSCLGLTNSSLFYLAIQSSRAVMRALS